MPLHPLLRSILLLPLLFGGFVVNSAETNVTPKLELYQKHCASCHEGGVPRAPHSVQFQMIGPQAVYDALTTGVMRTQASALTDKEKRFLAEALSGAKLPEGDPVADMPHCEGESAEFDRDQPPTLHGWGHSRANSRHIPASIARLEKDQVSRLKLKWAFAFPGATRSRSQPTHAAGALFMGSQDGTVYAIDEDTACVRWTFEAGSEVRNSPVIEPWTAGDKAAQPLLFFGDLKGWVYAVEAFTGKERWRIRADEHPNAIITGSPRLYQDTLYVPLSSSEWASAADPSYPCCTFRGGVVAMKASSGDEIWRSYAIEEKPTRREGTNDAGAPRYHPAGAPIWNSPTIDPERGLLYVGTGESYTSPAADTSDAVLAFDLETGERQWVYQALAGDAWNMACYIGGGPNCPEENGPDFDIGAPPVLAETPDGNTYLLVGQKSGDVFALDPDNGKLLWRDKYGRGGTAGGIHWGMAYNGQSLFVPIADTSMTGMEPGEPKPGLYSLHPDTGAVRWFHEAVDVCPEELKPACDEGFSAPVTSIPGVVFAGGFDGWLRAFDSENGELLWQYNTVRDYDTVNGVEGQGGSIESVGPLVINGQVLVNSGYLFGGRMPGNVLLSFTVEGE